MDIYHGQGKRPGDTVTSFLADTCVLSGHSLDMDNFYNSVELSEELLADKLHTVGTVRSHRGDPSEIRSAKSRDPKMKWRVCISRDNCKGKRRAMVKQNK